MKFSMTGQDKGDLLKQVTAWAGLIVLDNQIIICLSIYKHILVTNLYIYIYIYIAISSCAIPIVGFKYIVVFFLYYTINLE
jgi:hypothetical protein